MRSIRLLLLVAFILISTAAASADDQAAQTKNTFPLLTNPGTASQELNTQPHLFRFPSKPSDANPYWGIQRKGWTAAGENYWGITCYTMRTYHVELDEPGSDSTHTSGYSTCLPDSRVNVKGAVLKVGSGQQ